MTSWLLVRVPPAVTFPEPAGVAQVPSPRQKVDDDAEVPLFRLVTGRLPVTPVERGRPVAFVRVAEVGVPRMGVTKVGEVENTALPVPVSSVRKARRLAEFGVARKVAIPVPPPVSPVTGRAVAVMAPLPLAPRDAPVPTVMVAAVLVPVVR